MTNPANLLGGTPLAERIANAKDHMAGYRQHNETLWPHQSFALTLGELLDAAERGIKAADEIERLRALAAPSVPSGEPPKLIDMETINAAWEKRDPEFQRCFYSFVAGVAFAEKHCATPQPAPAGWRLLTRGEPIQMGDEGLQDDCATWLPVVGWEVGMDYNPGFLVPMRRKALAAAPAAPDAQKGAT